MGRYDVAVRGKERLWIILRDFRDDTEDVSDDKATLDRDLVDAAEHGRLYDGGRDTIGTLGSAAGAILIGQTGEWADPTRAAGSEEEARERGDMTVDGAIAGEEDGRASPGSRGTVTRKFVVVETSELPNKVQVRFDDGAKEELDVDVADCSNWSVIAPQEKRLAELEEIAKNIAVELVFAHYDDIGVDSQQPHSSYAALRWADHEHASAGAGGVALAQTPERSAIEALQQSVAQLQRQVAGDVAARASLAAAPPAPAVAAAAAADVMATAVTDMGASLALELESAAAALALAGDDAGAPVAPARVAARAAAHAAPPIVVVGDVAVGRGGGGGGGGAGAGARAAAIDAARCAPLPLPSPRARDERWAFALLPSRAAGGRVPPRVSDGDPSAGQGRVRGVSDVCDAQRGPLRGKVRPYGGGAARRHRATRERAQVSVLLFTVTFYANHAYNLTCSP